MGFVGKYENLIEDLGIICNKLNIFFDNWLFNVLGNIWIDRRYYLEILIEV